MAVFTGIIGAITAAAAEIGAVAGGLGITAAGVTATAGVAGAAAGGYGLYNQYQGAKKTQAAQEKAIQYQQDIEQKRQQQLNLDAMRRRREVFRQSYAARAMSLSVATNQGASQEGSSALGGAYGQISGRTNVNDLGIRQNQEIGNSIFTSNQGVFSAYRDSASAATQTAFGTGLTSLGGALMTNAGAIGRVGATFLGFGSHPTANGDASQGRYPA